MERKFYWKYETAYATIYWSLTFISFFLSMILFLEKATFHWKSLLFFIVFLLFVINNQKQYFCVSEAKVYLSKGVFGKEEWLFEEIDWIEINGHQLIISSHSKKRTVYLASKKVAEVTEIFKAIAPQKVNIQPNDD